MFQEWWVNMGRNLQTDQEKAYLAFVQRILLVRQYINNNPNKFVPLPSLWLDRNNQNGFAGTRQWYENMQAVRASLPTYKSELEAFANAIADMHDSDSITTFHHWRNYFIEKKTPTEIRLFKSLAPYSETGWDERELSPNLKWRTIVITKENLVDLKGFWQSELNQVMEELKSLLEKEFDSTPNKDTESKQSINLAENTTNKNYNNPLNFHQ